MKLHFTKESDCFFNELHELTENDFDTLYSAGRLLMCENLAKIKNYDGLFAYYENMSHIKINRLYVRKGLISYDSCITFTRTRGHYKCVPFRDAFILFDNKAEAAKFKLKNF